MDRLIAPNTVVAGQADTAPATGTPGYATDGNPATGVPATLWPSYQYNAIQEELIAILVAAGITPDRTSTSQIVAAIKRLVQKTVVLADTGAVNAYAATNAPPFVASTWVDGVAQAIKIAHTNTGASTYAPDGLPAIPIYGLGLQPLQGSELLLNGIAILMRLTIPGVNSGNPICVLMECAGGAQQIPPATQSQHAVQLSQVQQNYAWQGGFQGIPSTQTFTVPASVYKLRYRVWGGGGGSGGVGSSGNGAPGGGGAGGFSEGVISVTPGQTISCTIGAAGAAGSAAGAGGTGGTTSFTAGGTTISATGGAGGSGNISSGGAGGAGGAGVNGANNLIGGAGSAGAAASGPGGAGGTTSGGGGAGGGAGTGVGGAGSAPGGGGGAPGGTAANTGTVGGRGQINFEW